MAIQTFSHVKIKGMSYIMPDLKKSIDDDIHFFNNSENKLKRAKKIIGYGNRFISTDNVTATDLAESAAKDLISGMNIDINTIDMLIFVTSMQDYFSPSSAHILHSRLKLPITCSCLDIPHGCPGYLYGLWQASNLIESKACNKILLVAGDNETENKRCNNKSTRILGSGASCATLIEYSENKWDSFFMLGSDGTGCESITIPAGAARLPITKEILDTRVYDKLGQEWELTKTFMDGMNVFSFTTYFVPKIIEEMLIKSGKTVNDIDFFALHQANKQITKEIAEKTGIPENKYYTDTFTNYGNQICVASIGNLIDARLNEICNSKFTSAVISYGVGFSWAAAILTFDNIFCSGIVFKNFDHIPSRESNFNYWKNKIENMD